MKAPLFSGFVLLTILTTYHEFCLSWAAISCRVYSPTSSLKPVCFHFIHLWPQRKPLACFCPAELYCEGKSPKYRSGAAGNLQVSSYRNPFSTFLCSPCLDPCACSEKELKSRSNWFGLRLMAWLPSFFPLFFVGLPSLPSLFSLSGEAWWTGSGMHERGWEKTNSTANYCCFCAFFPAFLASQCFTSVVTKGKKKKKFGLV